LLVELNQLIYKTLNEFKNKLSYLNIKKKFGQ